MGLGPFQTWVTGSNAASHKMLEVIAISRVFGSGKCVKEFCLFHQRTVCRSWH